MKPGSTPKLQQVGPRRTSDEGEHSGYQGGPAQRVKAPSLCPAPTLQGKETTRQAFTHPYLCDTAQRGSRADIREGYAAALGQLSHPLAGRVLLPTSGVSGGKALAGLAVYSGGLDARAVVVLSFTLYFMPTAF